MLPNLHIRLAGASGYAFAGGPISPAPRVTLLGPTSAAYAMVLAPGTEIVTTGLLPQGWMALVGAAAAELSDRIIDAAAIWGDWKIDQLCDRLVSAVGDTARVAVLESFLLQETRNLSDITLARTAMIDQWLERSAGLSLDLLCAELGVSSRQAGRLTLELYGASPKTLAMKYRALRAAAIMTSHGEAGLERAMTPFADQSHLIRDFRRFVGWTPTAFARDRRNAAYATLEGRSRAGAVRPLALLS
ncbi:AraC family transcriptional regulator [Sphingobium sp. CFD-2]|uniref:AraC family transcriptional regulator n=1 Tax=Sphingobium sp. CFD-2 TaxID=2878542 RepID=UPI00214D0188|nr:AraC family transcriptional regulator [Sphingobium sp. CFD-2]